MGGWRPWRASGGRRAALDGMAARLGAGRGLQRQERLARHIRHIRKIIIFYLSSISAKRIERLFFIVFIINGTIFGNIIVAIQSLAPSMMRTVGSI
jgi:hypothetical protein